MFQQLQSRCYGLGDRQMLYNAARGNVDFIQRLKLDRKLEVHSGCVNTICWNDKGTSILSGSDDQHLMITNPYTGKVMHKIHSGHRQNIFSAKFLPSSNDTETVSCSGDGKIFYTNIERNDTNGTYLFDCHFGTAYEVIVIPNEASTFLSCGEDGTVRFFDLRAKTSCNKRSCNEDVLISCRSALTALTANPVLPWQLGIGCSDSSVRVYDRRMLGTRATGNYTGKGITGLMCSFTPPSLEKESYRVTSLNFSPDGKDVLVSYSSQFIYLFGTDNKEECREFSKDVSKTQEESESKQIDDNCDKTGTSLPKTAKSHTTLAEPSEGASSSRPEDDSLTRAPPVKRLRLRGDWSDTGPTARPERERQTGSGAPASNDNEQSSPAAGPGGPRSAIMNRMSDLLTRWLYGNSREGSDQPNEQEGNQSAPTGTESQSHENVQSQSQSPGNSQNQSSPNETDSQSHENVQSQSQSTGNSQNQTGTNEMFASPVSEESQAQFDIRNDNVELTHGIQSETTERSGDLCADGKHETLNIKEQTSQIGELTFGSEKSEQDSSDSKSDTSQTSFVQKIESMRVDDSDRCFPIDEVESAGTDDTYNPREPTLYPVSQVCNEAQETDVKVDSIAKGLQVKQSDCATLASKDEAGTSSVSQSVGVQKVHQSGQNNNDTLTVDSTGNEALSYNSDETGQYRETVSAAISSLRAQNVQPVVSLHYSSEGTSASMIKVGFTRFQSLEEEMTEDNREVGVASSDIVDQSLDRHIADTDKDRNVPHVSNRTDFNEMTDDDIDVDNDVSDLPELEKSKIDVKSDSEMQVVKSDKVIKNVGTSNETFASEHSLHAMNKDCDTESAFKPFSIKSSDNKQHLVLDKSQKETDLSKVSPDGASDEMPSCSYGIKEPSLEMISEESDDVVDVDKCTNNRTEPAQIEFDCSKGASNEPVIVDRDERMEIDNEPSTNLQQGRESSTRGQSTSRRRRIGHSGPPTGDFQLDEPGTRNRDTDSSDEDEPEQSAARRRTDFERTTAALKLQALHRLRQEAKEKKEMQTKNVFMPKVKRVFKGHRNARTMIKESNFWGDKFVLSGSDCGHVFIWDRYTSKVVMLLEADKHVVNCVQPHPFHTLLATSGIDYDVKIWAPLLQQSGFDEERAHEVIHRNEIMLEETRDTITVPAAFMLRVLASINSIRSGRRAAGRENVDNVDGDQEEAAADDE